MSDDFLFIKDQITRAKYIPRKEALKENKQATRDTRNRIPFTVTYDPALPIIHDILRKKQAILQSTERLRNIFKEVPVVAFRRSPNLLDLLVRYQLSCKRFSTEHPTQTRGCVLVPRTQLLIHSSLQSSLGNSKERRKQKLGAVYTEGGRS